MEIQPNREHAIECVVVPDNRRGEYPERCNTVRGNRLQPITGHRVQSLGRVDRG
jgi:hypothetical protein